MYYYRTYFKLSNSVNDFDAAYNYLTDDDMSVYLRNDTRIDAHIRFSVVEIKWILTDYDAGYVSLVTDRDLNDSELKAISKFVSGQNSDGLGEGFSQQDFANYKDEDPWRDEDEDDWYDNDDDYITCEFDWDTNDYIFEFVSKD